MSEFAQELRRRDLGTSASYVWDRFSALLRLPAAERQNVSAAGIEIGPRAILGWMVRLGDDNRWYQLFPIDLMQRLAALVRLRSAEVGLLDLTQSSDADVVLAGMGIGLNTSRDPLDLIAHERIPDWRPEDWISAMFSLHGMSKYRKMCQAPSIGVFGLFE